jgi:aryl sulfotransferase
MFDGEEGLETAEMSPWVDLRVPPKDIKLAAIEAQAHRRFLKTHLPVDALVFSQQAKYVYIGRDGRDVVWSMYNHHSNANQAWYDALNETPGRVGPPIDRLNVSIAKYFEEWLAQDGHPWYPFWENVRSWWAIRDLPNVHIMHFVNLKDDLPGEMQKLAAFLNIPINEEKWDDIVRHCTFDYMKANATKSVPLGGAFWDGGAQTFIHKGTNGRRRDVLSDEVVSSYECRADKELGPDCANWLATGEYP